MKKFEAIDTTRWKFPEMATLRSAYPSKVHRERKVNQILSDVEDKYCLKCFEKEFTVQFDDNKQMHQQVVSKDVRESRQPNQFSPVPSKKSESKDSRSPLDAEHDAQEHDVEPEMKAAESSSSIEINVLEEKYFKKWLKMTQENNAKRTSILKKKLSEENILNPVNLEEDLWNKWKDIENENEEMKKILFLHWTAYSNTNYSFEYSRYIKEYKRNPLKWMDSKHCISSCGLEVKATRRWMKIEKTFERLKDHFLHKCLSSSQDLKNEDIEELFLEKQRKNYQKIREFKNEDSGVSTNILKNSVNFQ